MNEQIKSYSQYSQDLVVLKLLEFKQNGYFLDIGCSHPIKFSNTYALEKNYNWNGLCVDAVDHTELYTKERKCIFENAAIHTHTGFTDFRLTNGIDDHFMLSSIIDDLVEPVNLNTRNSEIIKSKCITFKDLLIKYNAPKSIDYMSVDVEGAEFLILNSFPFDEYIVSVITFEAAISCTSFHKEKTKKIERLLKQHGYFFVKSLGHDFLFIHKSLNLK